MKTITTLLATAALIGGISVASAQQTPSQKMDEQAGGNNQAVERNPSGAPVGSKTYPSPTVGAGGMQSGNSGSVRKQDQVGRRQRPGGRTQSQRHDRRLEVQSIAALSRRHQVVA